VKQLIFQGAKAARSRQNPDTTNLGLYLQGITTYEEGLRRRERGDLQGSAQSFESAARKIGTALSQLSLNDPLPITSSDRNRSVGLAILFMGVFMLIIGAYVAPAGIVDKQSAVISVATMILAVGSTLVTWQAGVQRRCIFYIWLAAFIIIGALNGVSVIGSIIR
jgi:energy-converting hydrogenase Eha subunit E